MSAQPPSHRFLTANGPIQLPFTNNVRLALCRLVNEGAKKITVLFSSIGGSVDDGISLYTFLRALPVELTMHAVGPVSSIAVPIFLAGKIRKGSENATFFFHEFHWTYTLPQTDSLTMQKEHTTLLETATSWAKNVLKNNSKITDEDIHNKRYFDHPIIVGATEAMDLGIIQTIEEPIIPSANGSWVVV